MIIIGMIFSEGFVEDYCLSKKLFLVDFYFINYSVGNIKLLIEYFYRYLLKNIVKNYYVSKIYCNLIMNRKLENDIFICI
jgi:hypothetical protein